MMDRCFRAWGIRVGGGAGVRASESGGRGGGREGQERGEGGRRENK